eukprot:GHVR01133754.1.p1 GENE.GHVR01133754.1~~GHVR01133754.1.p1  ORF type:complete len:531 (+),score=88.67 GHVR01133754.1:116-1708(+)
MIEDRWHYWQRHERQNGLHVRVLCCAWNMQGKKPPEECKRLVRPDIPHDIVVFGTCECKWSIQRNFIVNSKSSIEDTLRRTLPSKFVPLRVHALQAIHLAVFVRRELKNKITKVHSSHVATGIGGVMGNKGGVGISFQLEGSKFCFVQMHLEAHQGKAHLLRRHAMLERVLREIDIPLISNQTIPNNNTRGKCKCRGLLSRLDRSKDRCFLMGDLNYRLKCDTHTASTLISQGKQQELFLLDELSSFLSPTLTDREKINKNNGFLRLPKKTRTQSTFNRALNQDAQQTISAESDTLIRSRSEPIFRHDLGHKCYTSSLRRRNSNFETKRNDKIHENNILNNQILPYTSCASKESIGVCDKETRWSADGDIPEGDNRSASPSARSDGELLDGPGNLQSHVGLTRFITQVYAELNEHYVDFEPSYKFECGSDVYIKNTPAWTDRILWRKPTLADDIQCMSYDIVRELRMSDHRAVFSQFQVKVHPRPAERRDSDVSVVPIARTRCGRFTGCGAFTGWCTCGTCKKNLCDVIL